MKTHAEFLEELKEYLTDQIAHGSGYIPNYAGVDGVAVAVANELLQKIQQFEAQLRGDKGDENDKC